MIFARPPAEATAAATAPFFEYFGQDDFGSGSQETHPGSALPRSTGLANGSVRTGHHLARPSALQPVTQLQSRGGNLNIR